VVTVLVVGLVGLGPVAPAQAAASTSEYASQVAALVNKSRTDRGLRALKVSTRISAIAEDWSGTMAATGDFKHNPRFSKQYPSGWSRAAENVAYRWTSSGQPSAGSVHQALMDSSGHRANILAKDTTHIGVGVSFVSRNGRTYVYVTENFARYASGNPDGTAQRTADRLSGPTRYETAVAIGAEAFPTSNEVVLVAGVQSSVVDGLVAAPFARYRKAPVLLTEKSRLAAATRADIKRRGISTAWIIGGKGVVSPKVVDELKGLGVRNVHRLAGNDRYSTSVRVAEKMPSGAGAIVASGRQANLIDAAAVSGPAAAAGQPVLLTDRSSLVAATAKELRRRGTTKVTIVGGSGAVSGDVVGSLKGMGMSVTRLGGSDRFSTAAKVAAHFVGTTGQRSAVVASGSDANLIDAMTGGVLGSATLLSTGQAPPSSTKAWIAERDVAHLTVVGGRGAVPAVAVDVLKTTR
jgi:putative cell wall-binding protein